MQRVEQELSVIQVVSAPVHVPGRPSGITGPERRAANLAGLWKKHGINVTILYPRRGALWNVFLESGVPLVDYELHGRWDLCSAKKIRQEIQSYGARVIHTQGGPAVDFTAVRAARQAGIAAVVTRPVMIADQVGRNRHALLLFGIIDRYYTLSRCDAIVAVSNNGFERLSSEAAGDKVHLIHNGVGSSLFAGGREQVAGGDAGQVQIGMVGHLLHYKGWNDFLRVAGLVSKRELNVRWHIVGEGPERARLEALAAELGISDRVVFHGLLQDVWPVLRQLNIFLLTSHREGLSVAVLEAMSVGLPVIATDVGGIGDQVTEGYNGHIVPVGNIEGLATRCQELVRDPATRLQMGINSRFRVECRFSQEAMLLGYVDLYRRVARDY